MQRIQERDGWTIEDPRRTQHPPHDPTSSIFWFPPSRQLAASRRRLQGPFLWARHHTRRSSLYGRIAPRLVICRAPRPLQRRILASTRSTSTSGPYHQRNMPFEPLHPNKTRSRSVQLDNAVASATVGPSPPPPRVAARSRSLAYRENVPPVYRSMLDLEPAPKLAPLKAMDLDGLRREVMPPSECQPSGFCIATGTWPGDSSCQ